MRFNKFRRLSVFALTALVTGTFALPTRAKEPIQSQPLLIAQSSVDTSESSLKLACSFTTTTPILSSKTSTIDIPVTDFTYTNGKVNAGGTQPYQGFKPSYGYLSPTQSNSACATSDLLAPTTGKVTSVNIEFDYTYIQATSLSQFLVGVYDINTGSINFSEISTPSEYPTGEQVNIPITGSPGDEYKIFFFLTPYPDTAGFSTYGNTTPPSTGYVTINFEYLYTVGCGCIFDGG